MCDRAASFAFHAAVQWKVKHVIACGSFFNHPSVWPRVASSYLQHVLPFPLQVIQQLESLSSVSLLVTCFLATTRLSDMQTGTLPRCDWLLENGCRAGRWELNSYLLNKHFVFMHANKDLRNINELQLYATFSRIFSIDVVLMQQLLFSCTVRNEITMYLTQK